MGKQLSVLHIGSFYEGGKNPFAGGKTASIMDIVAWNRRLGYAVTLLTPESSGARDSVVEGVRVVSIPHMTPSPRVFKALERRWPAAYEWLLGLLLRRFIRKNRFDLVHNHYGAFALLPIIKEAAPKLPVLSTLYAWHDLEEVVLKKPRNESMVERKTRWARDTIRASDEIVLIARHNVLTAEELGLRIPRFNTIYVPIDFDEMEIVDRKAAKAELGLPEGRKVVQFSGKISSWRKKFTLLMDCFEHTPELKEKYFLVVTGGLSDDSLPTRCKERGIPALFAGRVKDRATLNKYYNAADVFVMPSISEGWGVVYTEALAVGTPVVGYHRTIRELEELLGEPVGRPYDPAVESRDDLARKIIESAGLRPDAARFRAKLHDHFSRDAVYREYGRLYTKLGSG